MDTKELIQKIASGNVLAANEILNNIMSGKSIEALEAKKVELAKNIFNTQSNSEVENVEDPEVENQ